MSQVTQTDWVTESVSHLPPLATAIEAAAALRCSPRQLRRYIVAGQITGVRPRESGSSRVLVPRTSIENFLRGLVSP